MVCSFTVGALALQEKSSDNFIRHFHKAFCGNSQRIPSDDIFSLNDFSKGAARALDTVKKGCHFLSFE